MRRESLLYVVVLMWAAVVVTADRTPAAAKPTGGEVTKLPAAMENAGTRITSAKDMNHKEEVKGEVRAKEGEEKSDLAEEINKNRFFGRYTTTTEIAVVMVTSTVFFSCLSGTSAALCTGRRRKKDLLPLTDLNFDHDERYHLDSSQNTDTEGMAHSLDEALEAQAEEKDRKGNTKLFFGVNVWSRVRSTSTVTMLYTDTNTTIRLSYYCQAGNLQLPVNNCG
ncbi:hypothetical protein O3P69_002088 [Scylla paramamosain]|uniref:Uncharacterized protein n=2 Tax=Scylla paramamosain TaxID=85552 RepID=A0AAW0V529_SCYPA